MCVSTAFLITTSPSNGLGSEIFGTNKDIMPCGTPKFFYEMGTGYMNLCKHLFKYHPEEYNKAILDNHWPYKPLMVSNDVAVGNAQNFAIQSVLPFTEESFLEYLTHFIVADNQVCSLILYLFIISHIFKSIHIIECPEFQELLMVIWETLLNSEIPHHDKMRENIHSRWQSSFEELKLELSVGWTFIFLLLY